MDGNSKDGRGIAVLVLLLAPWVMAPKCMDYDERFDRSIGNSDSGEDGGEGFVPASSCQESGEARIVAQNYDFLIECGCAEELGKVCTIPIGTTVVWTFKDTDEHNVTSLAEEFGSSGDIFNGKFEYLFEEPGEFPYYCTLHRGMTGYQIVVLQE